jgi:hypothetical protein
VSHSEGQRNNECSDRIARHLLSEGGLSAISDEAKATPFSEAPMTCDLWLVIARAVYMGL